MPKSGYAKARLVVTEEHETILVAYIKRSIDIMFGLYNNTLYLGSLGSLFTYQGIVKELDQVLQSVHQSRILSFFIPTRLICTCYNYLQF